MAKKLSTDTNYYIGSRNAKALLGRETLKAFKERHNGESPQPLPRTSIRCERQKYYPSKFQ